MPDGHSQWSGHISLFVPKIILFLVAEQLNTWSCVCVCKDAVCPAGVPRFTKLYSPNLCLGKSIVGNVVVWFVSFMSGSGIPH